MTRLALAALALALPQMTNPPAPATADPTPDQLYAPNITFEGQLGSFVTRPRVRFKWSDSIPGDAQWELEIARADMTARRAPDWQPLALTSAQSQDVRVGSGKVACVRSRVVRAGEWSQWSPAVCAVRILDDQHLRAIGPHRQVRDRHYSDGRALVLWDRARLVAGRVPAHTLYGPVWTENTRPDNGPVCGAPMWAIRGHRGHKHIHGVGTESFIWMNKWSREGGVAEVWAGGTAVRDWPSCRIGGFLVLPRWLAGLQAEPAAL